jgi:HSP20 family protein
MRTATQQNDAQRLRAELKALFRDLNEVPWSPGGTTEAPAIDVLDLPGGVEMRIDLSAVGPDQMTVEMAGDMLRIRGGRRVEEETTAGAGRQASRRRRQFLRGLQLPATLRPESLEATLTNGLLTITLEKRLQRSRRA